MKAATRPVRVLMVAREEMARRLSKNIPHWCVLEACGLISDAMHSIQLRKVDAIVLDPSSIRLDMLMKALTSAADAGVGCVLYSALDQQSAIRIMQVVRIVRCEFVCVGADNEAEVFDHCFRSLESISAPALVASELAQIFLGLPSDIRMVFVGLFSGMPIPNAVSDLVALTGSTERGLERWCERLKLVSPHHLLVGARIARAWSTISAGETISEVARQNKWDSPDRFRSHFRGLIGMSPTDARRRMRTGDFAIQLATSLKRTEASEAIP